MKFNIFTYFLKSKLIKSGLGLTATHIAIGVLGYVYQIFIGRSLDGGSFAVFSAVMALTVIWGAPLSTMGMAIAKYVAKNSGINSEIELKAFYFEWLRRIIIFSIPILIIIIIFNSEINRLLKSDNQYTAILFFFIGVSSAYAMLNISFLQGREKFILIGFIGLSVAILKIILSGIFLKINLDVNSALLGVLLSNVIVSIFGILVIWGRRVQPDGSIGLKSSQLRFQDFKKQIPILIANICFLAMTQLDIVLVNSLFNIEDAGIYAAAAVLGRAVLYLPGGMVAALFPMASNVSGSKTPIKSGLLSQALFVTLIMCLAMCCIYGLFSSEIINLFYGGKYPGADHILWAYALAMVPMALVIVLEHYLIAKGVVIFAWIFLLLAPLEVFVLYFFHDSLIDIVITIGIFGVVMLFAGLLVYIKMISKLYINE